MMIVYGTYVFSKFKGYFGDEVECPHCHKNYKKSYVKYSTWAHLCYIPLFPIKIKYASMCPICGWGEELKRKEAKAEMLNSKDEEQRLDTYAKHILAKKPKGIMSVDTSYELYVKDLNKNEAICVVSGITKDTVKEMKKDRGLNKIPIINIE